MYVRTPLSPLPSYSSEQLDVPKANERSAPDTEPARQSHRQPLVLVVEDNPADVSLIQEALTEHGVRCETAVIDDGENAIRHIARMDAGEVDCPDLVVLDLNLPRRHGCEVLAAMRATGKCSAVPVVVLTSSIAVRDVQEAKALGVTEYIQKPMDLEEFIGLGAVLKRLLTESPQ